MIHYSRATMIREHLDNATDAEVGERIRALVAKGFNQFVIEPKPDWMTRETFLPVGETETRDNVFGMTPEEWQLGATREESQPDG